MPSILISRFIINLRQLDDHENEGTAGTTTMPAGRFSQFSVPNFRIPTADDIVGNMGEPLDRASVMEAEAEGVTDRSETLSSQDVAEGSLES